MDDQIEYVATTVRVGPGPDARRVHLITGATAAKILGVELSELEQEREITEGHPWGLGIVHCAPRGAEYVAEEVLELAELWEKAAR